MMHYEQEISELKKEIAELKKIVRKLWHIKEVDDAVINFSATLRRTKLDISVLEE